VRLLYVSLVLLASCSTTTRSLEPEDAGSSDREAGVHNEDGSLTGADAGQPDATLDDAEGAIDTGCVGPPGRRTVTGTRIDTYTTASGDMRAPGDLSHLQLLLLDSVTSCFATRPVITSSSGYFRIDNVPDGAYYLRVDPNWYVVSSSTSLELGVHRYGRPDAVLTSPSAMPTTLVLNATGLAPWQATDWLEIDSLNAGVTLALGDFAPMPGATTVSGLNLTWFDNLIDASQGDRATLAQQKTVHAPDGLDYVSVHEFAELPPFSLVNGGTTTVAAHLVGLAPLTTTTIAFVAHTFFNAALSAWHPHLSNAVMFCSINLAASNDVYGPTLAYYMTSTTGDSTLRLQHGNPYSPLWGTEHVVCGAAYQTYSTPSGDAILGDPIGAVGFSPVGTGQLTMTAPIAPVLNMMINGQGGSDDQSGVGVSPRVSWSPPQIGAATLYYVTILELRRDFNNILLEIARITDTASTEILIPPGVLESGKTYVIVVTAGSQSVLISGIAEASSGLLTP
jgi:hypothetical protein